jgi:magnesium chelatase subunit D
VSLHRGKYSRHRLGLGPDVAVDATLRAAAGRGSRVIEPADVRARIREHAVPLMVCFVVDNSYSIHAERMVEKVKGLAIRLLEDATHRGDRVALVAFKGGIAEASVVLPLTRSATLARRRLEGVPLSGQTPLADALRRARRLLRQEVRKRPNALPIVIAITDGLPTAALRPGGDALADVLGEARLLRRAGIPCVVADAAPEGETAGSCGPALAEASGGRYLRLNELVASPS